MENPWIAKGDLRCNVVYLQLARKNSRLLDKLEPTDSDRQQLTESVKIFNL